jgi:hypothetical protein
MFIPRKSTSEVEAAYFISEGDYIGRRLSLSILTIAFCVVGLRVAVATQAGRPGAATKAGRQQSARLSREGRMIGDLALSGRRLRFSK